MDKTEGLLDTESRNADYYGVAVNLSFFKDFFCYPAVQLVHWVGMPAIDNKGKS